MKEGLPAIIGTGIGLPSNRVDNAQIAHNLGKPEKVINRLMTPVGIQERRWVTPGLETAATLGADALRQALEMAEIDPDGLKTIIVASSSPDFIGVPTAALVQERLGIPTNVRAYDEAAACTGFVQALYDSFTNLTSEFGVEGPQAVIGSEIISPTLSKQKPLVYPLFGDGAGAVIVDNVQPDEGAPRNIGFAFGADGRFAENLGVMGGGSKHPTTQETVDNDMHSISMDGKIIKDQAIQRMAEMTRLALERAGVPLEEITLFVPHQANLDIMKSTAEALNFPVEKMMVTINKYGNTSASTIPIAIDEAIRTGQLKRNDMLAFATFGAGLSFAAGVIPMVGLPKI